MPSLLAALNKGKSTESLPESQAGNIRPRYSQAAAPSLSVPTTASLNAPIHAMYSSSRQQQQPGQAIGDEYDRMRPESEYDSNRESHYEQYDQHQQHAFGHSHAHRLTPPIDDDEHISNESGSGDSSTKIGSPVESRPQSAYRHQLSDGDHPNWREHASDSSHDAPGGGMYSQPGYNQSGYVDQPLYNNPSSPASSHAPGFQYRHRQGSYTGSGLDSARASTIGTDHIHGNGNNGSRVALNREWRQSADLDSINVATGKDGYSFGQQKTQPYTEKDGSTYVPIPPSSPAMGVSMNEKAGALPAAPGQPEPAIVLARANRMSWIDGLRGLASIVIFTHHYADLTWAGPNPQVLRWGTPESFIRNGQLAVAMYFLLGGRVLAHSFLRSAYQKPKPPKDSHGDLIPGGVAAKWMGPKWMSLSSSLFRRSIRLALPAVVVGFLQWQLAKADYFEDAKQAQGILKSDALWIPTWGAIGGFTGFLRFTIDLFTNNNHQYMLYLGSALWTTYDQFWGSVITYIVAGMMAPIAPRGRYITYALILFALFWMSSPNFLYIYGLMLADLHAGGYIRRVQNHWKPTIGLEVGIMIIGGFLIAGGRNNQFGADDFFGRWTLFEGVYSYDPRQVWPQYMNFSYFFAACCIITWIELSHAMQWFVSWGIFVWLGKVSYGFYLMQFITIYAFMPKLVIHFTAQGNSYWSVVIPAYVICLLLNFFLAWVSYHLLDRVGLKLGKWVWDGLFVTKPKNAAALPLKMAKALIYNIIHFPASFGKSVSENASTGYRKTKRALWLARYWRTPTTRPPVPYPTDPDMLAQLHSTRWTSDLSQDREATRTARLLSWQQFAWIPHLFIIPGFTFVWVWFHPTGQWTYDAFTFSTLWRFIWCLSLPNCFFAWLGFITPDWAPSKAYMDKKHVEREYVRNFFVLLVTKGSNESAVRRGYNKLLPLEKYHPAIKVIVLTDEPYVYPDLKNIVCPKNYKSPLGKAKYKARALDYFRYHVSLGTYDWILHMDEESTCDAETLRRCLEFVRYTKHHFGQGIILYNGEGYWDNWLFTVADGIRVGDDLARFHLQNTIFKRPIFGVHGSFLFTNGEMENECTWDFGSLAEDFEFSQDAWRRGFTCGRVHGIVREQSPTTVRDFLKQRRRWYMGIRDIKGMYGLPNLAINLWTIGVFTLAVTIINIPFMLFDKSLTPLWVAIIADFCFATFETIYIWGLLFQELDYGQPWYKIIMHLVCAIPIQPFGSILEGLSAIWAMSSEDFGKFEVIAKK